MSDSVIRWSEAGNFATGNACGIGVDSDDDRLYIHRGLSDGREVIHTARTKELTAASTLIGSDSGTTFFINNATGFITTLPAPVAGYRFTFINKTANTSGNHTIVTASSANVIKGNQNSVAGDAGDTSTADDTISFVANNSLAGDKVELFCDGTSWFAYAISRVAAGMTFTQAS